MAISANFYLLVKQLQEQQRLLWSFWEKNGNRHYIEREKKKSFVGGGGGDGSAGNADFALARKPSLH